MTSEEKVVILGALFHDIGKYEQYCTGNPRKEKHWTLGKELLSSDGLKHRFEAIVGKDHIQSLYNIVSGHTDKEATGLTKYIQEADFLSAGERVKQEENETYQDQWENKHLCSLFSKVQLLSTKKADLRYYKHRILSRTDFDVFIPELEQGGKEAENLSYGEGDWENFKNDLKSVLDFYIDEGDFNSLVIYC